MESTKQNIYSEDEAKIAEELRVRNLDKTNEKCREVIPRRGVYVRYIKRVLDLCIAIPAFILFLPLNVIFAVCTFIDVGMPVLYRQNRTGLDGKEFELVKFRNMKEMFDENGNLLPASQRVTGFGKIMRKYSFDELLNFWSVIKGDMSIIGPRPYPTFFTERMSERHKKRHLVRPGIECPKMISLPNEETRKYEVKLENDIWYVENVSFINDFRMIFKLIKMVFSIKIRARHAGALSYFVGYDDNGFAMSYREAKEYFENEKAINA